MMKNYSEVKEHEAFHLSGFFGLVLVVVLGLVTYSLGSYSLIGGLPIGIGAIFTGILCFLSLTSFVIVEPQTAKIVQLFGTYKGTIRNPGLKWTLPLTSTSAMTLRLRNFESPRLKVNDADGNPVEVAAIVVWKIVDTAQAKFNVDSLATFIEKQTESALRGLATKYPYDKHESHTLSLHQNIDEINEQLKQRVSESLLTAGIQIMEARISHLAYAPEIAAAMLQRQQAQAIIQARQKIVDGAVGMVEMALKQLLKNGIVQLDEERKASMVSNLLVVLCSERPSQPVLNTGTIY